MYEPQDVNGQLATMKALQARLYSDHGHLAQVWVSSRQGERLFIVVNVAGRGLAEVYLEAFLERYLYLRRRELYSVLDAFEGAMEYAKLESLDPTGWQDWGGWDVVFWEQVGVTL